MENLKKLAKWGKFIGWITLILGTISAVFGLLFFIIGAIPGAITAILGWTLVKATQSAEKLANDITDEQSFAEMIKNLALYFKMQGIYMIVIFVIYFIIFAMFIVLGVGGGLEGLSNF